MQNAVVPVRVQKGLARSPTICYDTVRVHKADRGAAFGKIAPVREHMSPSPLISAADLGPLLRSARKGMGMSQQRFADLAGVGRRFVSELEAGKPSLEFDRVLLVCRAAGIDLLAVPR